MRALIQRVSSASVHVGDRMVAEIEQGLVILLGIGEKDQADVIEPLTRKIVNLRIFEDQDEKMNLSLLDTGGDALVVSQFTLYADTRRGRRPSFTGAAPPDHAAALVEKFIHQMRELGVSTSGGEFGAHMLVKINNDGPVTIWLES
jgi:D-tyrosyl-tRNA(Tyr) deacylase